MCAEEVAKNLTLFCCQHFNLLLYGSIVSYSQALLWSSKVCTPGEQTKQPYALEAIENGLFDFFHCTFDSKFACRSKAKWFACNHTICFALLGIGKLLSRSSVMRDLSGWTADGEMENITCWSGRYRLMVVVVFSCGRRNKQKTKSDYV